MINGVLILICSFFQSKFIGDVEKVNVSLDEINAIKKVLEKTFEIIGTKQWYSFEEFAIFDLRLIFARIEDTALNSENLDTCTIEKEDIENYLKTINWRFVEV